MNNSKNMSVEYNEIKRLGFIFLVLVALIFPLNAFSEEDVQSGYLESFSSVGEVYFNQFTLFIGDEASAYLAGNRGRFSRGIARYKFVINPAGEIIDIQLIEVVENKVFADEFLAFAKTITHFKPFPDEVREVADIVEIIRLVNSNASN
jgi:hypothetical protein